MNEKSLPASPNWYWSRCSDVSSAGLMGVGAKNVIYLIDVTASSCRVSGELVGHKDVVSSFSFCHHAEHSHRCVSASTDGSVRLWDSDSATMTRELAAHQHPVSAVHWSPVDQNLVVSGDEKGIVMCHWHNTGDTGSLFPEPRSIVCLTCSPHTWSCVAVGYKDGMIVLIDVSKKGEVMHRLRGHDDEIHSLAWSPLANEEVFNNRPEESEVTASNGVRAAGANGCYLASGSKDQTVRVWSSARGKGVMTLKLPYLKRRGSAVDPSVKERLWLSVHWPKQRPTQLVSSSFSGELVMWDLTRTGKHRCSVFASSSDGQNHSRIVFNISSVQLVDGRELLITTSMDREIKCWDLDSLDCCWTLPTLGGFVYALTFSPVGVGCLALGVGDNMIRVWNTLSSQNQYDIRTFWQGVKSKVTALAWHPHREASLAFGTDDGKVGIYDVFSNKPPQISNSYHRKTVYTVAWGPPLPPLSFGAPAGPSSCSLYSCAGEGVILQHAPAKLSGEATDIDQLIRDTNDITHKLPPHTELSWKPDGKVLAIGNEDGCIDVYEAPSLKMLCSIQQHHKIINTLRWHGGHERHCLLASGSANAIVYVHDLQCIMEDPPARPAVLTEPYRRLCGHTAKITDMAWSPHHDARLVTVSYDGTAQVWDVLQEAPLANYRGHSGYLLSVDWSPVDPDVIWTGGKDFTVQQWNVSTQEFTKPPAGKKMVVLKEKNKSTSKQKKKNAKKAPSCGGSATAETEGAAELSDEEEKEEVSSASASSEMLKKSSAATKTKDKPDSNLQKKKKPRSVLPLSTALDHLPREALLQDCVTLASVHYSQAPPAGCVPGLGDHVHLGLFADRQALSRMFQAEEHGHVEAGHFDSVVYLRLWSGDLQGALQLATEKGELNEHLLSMAPMAGFQVWRRSVEAFVQQLCRQEQYLKAAAHLLSIDKVYEAVELLRAHKLYREAVALAKARLPADEPVLKELFTCWAAALERDGHFSAAAKCFLATGATFEAAKVIARKNDLSSLKTAATLARICGEEALARSLALRCAKELAAAEDWTGAQAALDPLDALLVHRLHLALAELLASELQDARVNAPAPGHPRLSPGGRGTSFLDRARDVWAERFGVSQKSEKPGGVDELLQELKSADAPTPSANVPLRQVLMYSSLHLTRAGLSWLRGDDVQLLLELWRAVTWPREAADFTVCAQICRLLFPDGDVSNCSRMDPKHLDPKEEEAHAAVSSLQAFVSYHRLYESWWKHCSSRPTESRRPAAESRPEHEAELQTSEEASGTATFHSLDVDASRLLSEPLAACQHAQKSIGEIQRRLNVMVTQHSRVQGGPPGPGENRGDEPSDARSATDAEKHCEEEETLLSLSSNMSKHQEELAHLPDTIKMFPHPDVLEMCLVLLHLHKSRPFLSDCLQQKAKDLLQKYATRPSVLRAARKFLT